MPLFLVQISCSDAPRLALSWRQALNSLTMRKEPNAAARERRITDLKSGDLTPLWGDHLESVNHFSLAVSVTWFGLCQSWETECDID